MILHTGVLSVVKKGLFLVLLFLVKFCLALKTRRLSLIKAKNSINKNFQFCKVKVISKSLPRLSNLFQFKYEVPFSRLQCSLQTTLWYMQLWQNIPLIGCLTVSGKSGISSLICRKVENLRAYCCKRSSSFLSSFSFHYGFQTFNNFEFHLKIKKVYLYHLKRLF